MVRLNYCRLSLITGTAQNIQVAAGERDRSVEETSSGIDRQLKGDALGVVLLIFCVHNSGHYPGQIVVMGAVRQGEQLPCRVTEKRADKNRSVGNPIAAVTGNRKSSAGGESSAILQASAGERAGLKSYRSQIACDQSTTIKIVY